LIKVSEIAKGDELDFLLNESEELKKILASIVKTSREK
jgi:hypothetical protein